MKSFKLYIIAIVSLLFVTGCDKDDVDINRVFNNYLLAQIDSAESFKLSIIEGANEGQYKVGSKALLQAKIDKAKAVYNNSASNQAVTDTAYFQLLLDIQNFSDQMNPYISVLSSLIQEGEDLV